MTGLQENVQKPHYLTLKPPINIFKISAVSLFVFHLPPTSYKKKTNEPPMRNLKTNQQINRQGQLLRTPLRKYGVQNMWLRFISFKL